MYIYMSRCIKMYLYLCYFTFGWCFAFSAIAVQFTMINDLLFSPVEVSYSMALITFPWCLKPFYGLLSDVFQIFDWGNRRPYISMSLFLASFLYIYINLTIHSKKLFIASLMTISFAVCYADVCADSIMVKIAKKENKKGNIQSLCWASRAFGALTGACFGGVSYTSIGALNVFRICAIMPFITSILIWRLPKTQLQNTNIDVFYKLSDNVRDQKRLAFLLFIINIAPNYAEFYTYYLQTELNYTPKQFAWMTVSGSLSFLLATITFNRVLTNKPPASIIIIGLIGTYVCRLAQLFVVFNIFPYFWIVLLDGVAESFFGTLILMPLLVIVAESCKNGIEGSLYAMMMAISNLSTTLGNWFGTIVGYIFGVSRTNFNNLSWFIIICATLELLIPLIAIRKTPSVSKDSVHRDSIDLDRTLEPDDPQILVNSKATLVRLEENNLVNSENTEDFWGKRPWQYLQPNDSDRIEDHLESI